LADSAVLRVFLAEVHYISNLTSGIPSVKEPGAEAEDGEHFASVLEMNNGSFHISKAARVVIHSGSTSSNRMF
jgi:hypothetical protein